jgi:DNA-binding transcriptional LysR family regulator
MRYRSMAGVANAVAAGVSLAPLPGLVFEDLAFKDVLVPVLSEYPLESPTLYVVYASRKYLPLKIRAFIDFLFEPIFPATKRCVNQVTLPGCRMQP